MKNNLNGSALVAGNAKRPVPKQSTSFLGEDFLLQTETARYLYHEYAKDMPIIDYHCHLSPELIARNTNFSNMTQLWLAGDHYKWRALRTLGIEENKITGSATDEEKFRTWATAVPYTMRNPLYHWSHMELNNPFGFKELLSAQTASKAWAHCNELLQEPRFTPGGLLVHFGVEMVGTTDDPVDDLNNHKEIAASGSGVKILPSFRPDKVLNLSGGASYRSYLQQLSQASGVTICNMDSLLEALEKRVDYFHAHGCRVSDHGLACMPMRGRGKEKMEKVFIGVLAGYDREAADYQEEFSALILKELCKMYSHRGWVQQFHVGALRNANTRKLQLNGPDTGYDSIGDFAQVASMVSFLNELEQDDLLAKTIIYNLNPADNAAFASLIGNYQGEGIRGKVQFGSAWWFLDQLDGMKSQLDALSSMGLLSCFVGMLTDSRSFLSYSRHEYFRRLLCNMLGNDIEQGLLPSDLPFIGKMVKNICYHNARQYFDL
jgi:glucuronate isomerase